MIYLIQTIACSAIFYLAFHFLFKDKNEHVFNRFYLVSSVLLAAMIPLCQIPVFPEYIDVVSSGQPITRIVKETIQPVYTFSWMDAVYAIYLLGMVIHAGLFITRLSQIIRIIKSGTRKLENGIVQVITEKNIPVSSFLTYLFIPKEEEDSISKYELYHEEIHIRQKHSWDIIFLEIMRIIFWFNPFIILHKKRLIEIHEFLADEYTSKVFDQEDYENFLAMKTCKTTNIQQELVHNFYSLFEKRIKMMNSNKNTKAWQYGLVLPMIMIAFMAFSTESYPVYNLENESGIIDSNQDSFPPMPPELIGQEVDTFVTFDPDTYEETITYQLSSVTNALEKPAIVETDKLVMFNPDTYEETILTLPRSKRKDFAKATSKELLSLFVDVKAAKFNIEDYKGVVILNVDSGEKHIIK